MIKNRPKLEREIVPRNQLREAHSVVGDYGGPLWNHGLWIRPIFSQFLVDLLAYFSDEVNKREIVSVRRRFQGGGIDTDTDTYIDR